MSEPADDKAYPAAAAKALGRMYGEMFVGMIEAGMSREEALEVAVEYAAAMARSSSGTKQEESGK